MLSLPYLTVCSQQKVAVSELELTINWTIFLISQEGIFDSGFYVACILEKKLKKKLTAYVKDLFQCEFIDVLVRRPIHQSV